MADRLGLSTEMKVLLNISRPLLGVWIDCRRVQGFRLLEQPDGSFNLDETRNLRAAQQEDEELAEIRNMLRGE